jgi:hypothetical protein
MEQAVLIVRAEDLSYVNESFSRLYFGHEFCERRLPPCSSLEKVLSFAKKRQMEFSFVTPYVTTAGLKKTETLLELLRRRKLPCEVIVNDFGVLNLINRHYQEFTPVLGRLLTKQKRSPELARVLRREFKPRYFADPDIPERRVLLLQKKLPLEMDLYYKGSNTSSVPIIHDFLVEQRIRRIELDNVAQGLHLELPTDKMTASVYFPYVHITTTFFCPTAGCDQEEKTFLRIKPCRQPCQRYVFALKHKSMPKVIYLRGNTQFYKNEKKQLADWQKAGVSRLVYEPQIPV